MLTRAVQPTEEISSSAVSSEDMLLDALLRPDPTDVEGVFVEGPTNGESAIEAFPQDPDDESW